MNDRSGDSSPVWVQELALFIHRRHGHVTTSTESDTLPARSACSQLFPHPEGHCHHPSQEVPGPRTWNLQLGTGASLSAAGSAV